MKHLLKITMSFLILSAAGAAAADIAMVQISPVATAEVSLDAPVSAAKGDGMVNARGDVNEGGAGVNETEPIEVNKAALRDSDVNIEITRQEVIRDTGKLSDDRTKLEKAQTAKDDQAAAKINTDVESDRDAVSKDWERLKKHLENKIENDRVIVRLFDEKIKESREGVDRAARKMSDDRAKLDDARWRYVADEIERQKTAVENDKTAVDGDTEKLNQRAADKAQYVIVLNNDNRHLDAVIKHLSEGDQAPVAYNISAGNKDSVKP